MPIFMNFCPIKNALSLCVQAFAFVLLTIRIGAAPGSITVDVQAPPPPAAPLYTAVIDEHVSLSAASIDTRADIRLHIVQGHPNIYTLGLNGEGAVTNVSGKRLHDWAIREEQGAIGARKFLDLRLSDRDDEDTDREQTRDFQITVETHKRLEQIPAHVNIMLMAPGKTSSFHASIIVDPATNVGFSVDVAHGLAALANTTNDRRRSFLAQANHQLHLSVFPAAGGASEVEILGTTVTGTLAKTGMSADFILNTQFNSARTGARLPLLSGRAALSGEVSGPGWHAELAKIDNGDATYDLVADRAGIIPVTVKFAAAVIERSGWYTFDFAIPAGAAVPIHLSGLSIESQFKDDAPVVPSIDGSVWKAFLPSDGSLALAWKVQRATTNGALFFTADERADLRVGAGLIRASSRFELNILQGKLATLQLNVEGSGEILNVEGANISSWKISAEKNNRRVTIQFSQPIEQRSTFVIVSQTELSALPATLMPLKLSVDGALRQSGFLRLDPQGDVRLEIGTTHGMLQLPSDQFPDSSRPREGSHVAVYRFPSSNYSYQLTANRIQPEVSISEVSLYRLTDSDRVIESDLELDIREAPIREFTLRIPADYTVAAVSGSAISDYSVASAETNGQRNLRLLFAAATDGRQLIHLQLERNELPKPGEWTLPRVEFPEAKTVRGNIGVVTSPGFRVTAVRTSEMVEIPLSAFPTQAAGLQQAWRLRNGAWNAVTHLEALGQSVQADVFHLYTVKPGTVAGSVLINYFVVGSPASEWRIAVPQKLGNVDILGDQVRRDWHREGDVIVVALRQPVVGAATLMVTFDQPFEASGGEIHPGEVRPVGVQNERGYVEVVSSRQIRSTLLSAEGAALIALDAGELPPEFRLLSSSPALATYQYTERPFQLALTIQDYARSETIDQSIDYADLQSEITQEGDIATEADYTVRTRGTSPLRMALSPDDVLWELLVNKRATSAARDGNNLLIPLPSSGATNEPIHVKIRFGQRHMTNGLHASFQLAAPKLTVPIIATKWSVSAQANARLRPLSGTMQPNKTFPVVNGFTELASEGPVESCVFVGFVLVATSLMRKKRVLIRAIAIVASLSALLIGWTLLIRVTRTPAPESYARTLQYSSSYVAAGSDLRIEITDTLNGSHLVAISVLTALACVIAGIWVWLQHERRPVIARTLLAVSVAGGTTSALLQTSGAAIFVSGLLVITALLTFSTALTFVRTGGWGWLKTNLRGGSFGLFHGGTAIVLAIATGVAVLSTPQVVRGDNGVVSTTWIQPGIKMADRSVQSWSIKSHRIFADLDIELRGEPGDSFELLRPPAILTGFRGEGVRIVKQRQGTDTIYFLTPEHAGTLRAHATFEMPLVNATEAIHLPSGLAQSQTLSVTLDEGGWEISSDNAVQIEQILEVKPDHSGATLVLAPALNAEIHLHPRQRNPAKEPTEFYTESRQLFQATSGAVNGHADFSIRPIRGQVRELVMILPNGMIVGEVTGAHVGLWRFDPVAKQLRIAIEPAQERPFNVHVESQLSTEALPYAVSLSPLHVLEAHGDGGFLGLALGAEVTAESVQAVGLTAMNLSDFPYDNNAGKEVTRKELATQVQQVWHFSSAPSSMTLRAVPIQPDVRVDSKERISLDDDRVVVAADLDFEISRTGIFKTTIELPKQLEIEALSGEAVQQWSEKNSPDEHTVTIQFHGKIIGATSIALTLTGGSPRIRAAWDVPKIRVRDATRQIGTDLVVPGKGLRLREISREHATTADPHAFGALQPGTLAFTELDPSATVQLAIEAVSPWVTADTLQEVNLRDGQTLTHIVAHLHVENAALKKVLFKLPGLTPATQRTVRATGKGVSELEKIDGNDNAWELKMARPIIGDMELIIDFQGAETSAGSAADSRMISAILFPEARQQTAYVALRPAPRLELSFNTIPPAWQKIDWNETPTDLQDSQNREAPAAIFRLREPAIPLTVQLSRHQIAAGLALKISSIELTTLLSNSQHSVLTQADVNTHVAEKQRCLFSLPARSQLFSVTIDGECVTTVRDGDRYAFILTPPKANQASASVKIVYAHEAQQALQKLEAPRFDVPVENLTWRVAVPAGYTISHEETALNEIGSMPIEDQPLNERINDGVSGADNARTNSKLLEAAGSCLASGKQVEAADLLQRAANSEALDDASNEDARVQLKKLKMDQAQLSLSTRRQRLYTSGASRPDGAFTDVDRRAATTENPLLRGGLNFDAQQLEQVLGINTAEENESLAAISDKFVERQLDRETRPTQIQPTLRARGTLVTFQRSLQVESNLPLTIALSLEKIKPSSSRNFAVALVGMVVICAQTYCWGRKSFSSSKAST